MAVPEDIGRYLAEMKHQLLQLVDWPEDELPAEEKLAFFRETRHTFGRTALLLSGGGGLGTFHIGVVKALFEQRLLPRVLAGSSVGSIGEWHHSSVPGAVRPAYWLAMQLPCLVEAVVRPIQNAGGCGHAEDGRECLKGHNTNGI